MAKDAKAVPPSVDPSVESDSEPVLTVKAKILLLSCIGGVVLVADQLTKKWAIASLKGEAVRSYLDGAIKLLYAENTGAWGSLGADWSEPLKLVVMIGLPCLVLGWVCWRVLHDHQIRTKEAVGYALIAGGGFGNIIDRIADGFVVDFLWMGVGPLTTNIFNIADVAIMAAFAVLIWDAWEQHRIAKAAKAETTETADSTP